MSVVRVSQLGRQFGALHAVADLSFDVEEGELFGLVGPDGAGKTTTMRLLAGVMAPTAGDAWVAGHHVVKDAEGLKSEIGYMSQRFGLYPDLTVEENVGFYADLYGVPYRGRAAKMGRLLDFSDLTRFKKRLAGNLSGGMKQKLGLVCALIHTPKVLFLDEPTNGVDPVSRRDFWRILYTLLREKVTVVVSTAYLDEAERCSRLGLMHQGKLFALGTPEEVKGQFGRTLLEIRCESPRAVARHLRAELPGDSVGLFGDRVHLACRDEARARAVLTTVMGEETYQVAQAEPSLEDVFVSVLASQEASNAD